MESINRKYLVGFSKVLKVEPQSFDVLFLTIYCCVDKSFGGRRVVIVVFGSEVSCLDGV